MSRILSNTNMYLISKAIRVSKVSQYDIEKLKLVKLMNHTFRNRTISITSSTNIYIPFRQFHYNNQKLQNKKENEKDHKELVKAYESPYAGLSPAEKVKEAGKDVTYLGVILVGIGIFGYIFYALFGELLSSSSPSGLYSYAFKQCKRNTQIKDICGEPLKGYGETTKRGRRRNVSHIEFMEDGIKCMRIKFYVEGPHNKGTVTLEAKKNESKKYKIQFIYVEFGGIQPRVIVIEDNR